MISDSDYKKFVEGLPDTKVKVPLEDLWLALERCFPAEMGSGRGRGLLARLIERLEADGYRLPSRKGKGNYDHLDQPSIPRWIMRPASEAVEKFRADKYLWAEELSFLSEQRHLQNHDAWLALDQWFKAKRNTPVSSAPLRERSYEIFRDEKALDRLRRTTPFLVGNISLKELHCFVVYEPLPTEHGPVSVQGGPALVVENQTTHWTISQWNKHAGRYACVIYGGGNKFSSAWEWIQWKLPELGISDVRYFGDLDVAGIEIFQRAAAGISAAEAFPFALEVELYRLVLNAERGKEPPVSQGKTKVTNAHLSVFPEDMRQEIEEILSAGKRIPQETITREILSQLGNII